MNFVGVIVLWMGLSSVHGYTRTNESLTNVPVGIPSNTTEISLRFNNITGIGVNDFANLSSLIKLDLAYNKISSIAEYAFKDLVKLQDMILTENDLTSLQDHTFNGLSSLLNLYLDDNEVNPIENDALNLPSLKYLSMLRNKMAVLPNISRLTSLETLFFVSNALTVIPDNAYANIAPVDIFFNGNPIVSLPPFGDSCRRLTRLRVYRMNLTRMPDNVLATCDKLAYIQISLNYLTSLDWLKVLGNSLATLYMTNNLITKIDSETFATVKGMRSLDLKNNRINSFDVRSLRYMTDENLSINLNNNNITSFGDPHPWCQSKVCASMKIFLTGNPLVCDHTFCWAKHFTNFTLSRDGCFSKSWTAVTFEDLNCEVHNVMMKLVEFTNTAYYKKAVVFNSNFVRTSRIYLSISKCASWCTMENTCKYFQFEDKRNCTIWKL